MNRLFFTRRGNRIVSVLTLIIAAIPLLFYKITGRLPFLGILPPCLFHLITGYNCPGCGGTRALGALYLFDLSAAFWYNPLITLFFILLFIWFLWFVKNAFWGTYKVPFQSKLYSIIPILFGIAMLIFTLVRNTEWYRGFFY